MLKCGAKMTTTKKARTARGSSAGPECTVEGPAEEAAKALREAVDAALGPRASFAQREGAYEEILAGILRKAAKDGGA
jgi:hypothetical protein